MCHHVDNHENCKLRKVRLLNVGGRGRSEGPKIENNLFACITN